MKNVYEVLRQKEFEVSRLKKEVEALRLAASLLLADGEAKDYNQPTSQAAATDSPQPDHSWGGVSRTRSGSDSAARR
jgi:hypothetical protein